MYTNAHVYMTEMQVRTVIIGLCIISMFTYKTWK